MSGDAIKPPIHSRREPNAWDRFGYAAVRAAGSFRAFAAAWHGREWTMAEAERRGDADE